MCSLQRGVSIIWWHASSVCGVTLIAGQKQASLGTGQTAVRSWGGHLNQKIEIRFLRKPEQNFTLWNYLALGFECCRLETSPVLYPQLLSLIIQHINKYIHVWMLWVVSFPPPSTCMTNVEEKSNVIVPAWDGIIEIHEKNFVFYYLVMAAAISNEPEILLSSSF